MLAHVPSFGRNPRGSQDFLAYPVPKACQRRILGTWVPRCLCVARSALSPKAAQALGCSLTLPWHRLPQCPCYGYWDSYCCVARVLGFGARLALGSPGFRFWCSSVSLPSWLGLAVCAGGCGWRLFHACFGSGLLRACLGAGCRVRGWYVGRGVSPFPPLLARADGWCPGTGWDVTSSCWTAFVGGVCE